MGTLATSACGNIHVFPNLAMRRQLGRRSWKLGRSHWQTGTRWHCDVVGL